MFWIMFVGVKLVSLSAIIWANVQVMWTGNDNLGTCLQWEKLITYVIL